MTSLNISSTSRWLSCLLLTLTVAGCQSSKNVYYWGHYETVVYNQYQPGKNQPEKLSALLEEDEQKAASKNKPLAPGFHAQLGYLYAVEGKNDDARKEYLLEKQEFPESAVFMDRFLNIKTNVVPVVSTNAISKNETTH
jgi:hypothetical protein